jgi:hypothetical protein
MAEVERSLENDPQLQRDLAALEATLAPLGFPDRDDDASYDPLPPGLVARTCDFIDDAKQPLAARPRRVADGAPRGVVTLGPEPVGGTRNLARWADVVVTASVVLAACTLLFPAILSSRQSAQVAACQNNLRNLGVAVAQSAAFAPDGRIPAIATHGNRSTAGIFAPLLQDQQLLEDPRSLVCPSSELAERSSTFRVPTLTEVDRATGPTLVNLRRTMAGSYAYNLGFVENGKYQAPQHQGRANYALLSDAPATFSPARRTKNHASRGQNILCEDGSVDFVVNLPDDLYDDPYLNRSGQVAAGLDCSDIVLGESNASPLPVVFGRNF